jgi:ERCC4-type nuclease
MRKKKTINVIQHDDTIHLLNYRTVKVFLSCHTAILRLVIFTLTLPQKFEISYFKLSLINSLSFIQSMYYLHEMAEQEKDMNRKRILLTAREKQGIVNYCWE